MRTLSNVVFVIFEKRGRASERKESHKRSGVQLSPLLQTRTVLHFPFIFLHYIPTSGIRIGDISWMPLFLQLVKDLRDIEEGGVPSVKRGDSSRCCEMF